jgi:VanZ family protein
MNLIFTIFSIAYIFCIFFWADSPVVSNMATYNPYSLLHIPLYGILTILLVLSFRRKPSNPINPMNSTNSRNPIIAGLIALVVAVADEIHQAYIPSRDASIIDVFLDIVGISLCLLLIKRIGQISGFSKIPKFLRRIP